QLACAPPPFDDAALPSLDHGRLLRRKRWRAVGCSGRAFSHTASAETRFLLWCVVISANGSNGSQSAPTFSQT
ncbi:MAG: hypothetical protein WA704_08665, partial [Pseudolabrys sp.]